MEKKEGNTHVVPPSEIEFTGVCRWRCECRRELWADSDKANEVVCECGKVWRVGWRGPLIRLVWIDSVRPSPCLIHYRLAILCSCGREAYGTYVNEAIGVFEDHREVGTWVIRLLFDVSSCNIWSNASHKVARLSVIVDGDPFWHQNSADVYGEIPESGWAEHGNVLQVWIKMVAGKVVKVAYSDVF